MRRYTFNFLVLLAIMSALTRMASAGAAPAQSTEAATVAINNLGIELLQKSSSPGANALISPYSIQSALAMAYAGADGQTREEMARVLHYGADDAALHAAFAVLRKTLEELVQMSEQSSQKMQQFRMTNDPIMLAV